MLTEEEAKTKWCPLARYKSVNGEGINRWVNIADTQLNPDPARCIASFCMAWRQAPLIVGGSIPEIAGPRKGYCGAFGWLA